MTYLEKLKEDKNLEITEEMVMPPFYTKSDETLQKMLQNI